MQEIRGMRASLQDAQQRRQQRFSARLSRYLPQISCLIALCFTALPLNAAELKVIQQRGYLKVAVKDNLRPLGFRDAQGNLQGLEIDIARQLAAELLGNPNAIRFQTVSNTERLTAVAEDQVDVAIARVTVTGVRSRLVDFSPPYYIDGTTFITQDSTIQTLEALAQHKIAVLEGSSTIASVRYFIPQAQLVGVKSYQEALALLEAGEATAFAADASVLTGWVQEYPQYRLLPSLISAEALAIVLPKGVQYAPLREQVNSTLARWKASGWLQKRAKFWGLPLPQ